MAVIETFPALGNVAVVVAASGLAKIFVAPIQYANFIPSMAAAVTVRIDPPA
jgi:hypothetical protein